jgi:hypothetical protein
MLPSAGVPIAECSNGVRRIASSGPNADPIPFETVNLWLFGDFTGAVAGSVAALISSVP